MLVLAGEAVLARRLPDRRQRLQRFTGGIEHVTGSRYFSLEKIKAKAPSLAEGKVPNFNGVQRDLLALNRHPDRQVTPTIRPGAEPGTFDVDLTVKDKLPLHGSLELNNRNSPDTTSLRLNGAISYSNLWQAGHTLGLSFQIAPERAWIPARPCSLQSICGRVKRPKSSFYWEMRHRRRSSRK